MIIKKNSAEGMHSTKISTRACFDKAELHSLFLLGWNHPKLESAVCVQWLALNKSSCEHFFSCIWRSLWRTYWREKTKKKKEKKGWCCRLHATDGLKKIFRTPSETLLLLKSHPSHYPKPIPVVLHFTTSLILKLLCSKFSFKHILQNQALRC